MMCPSSKDHNRIEKETFIPRGSWRSSGHTSWGRTGQMGVGRSTGAMPVLRGTVDHFGVPRLRSDRSI